MQFLSVDHHKCFLEIKNQMPDNFNGDLALLSVVYIMASSKQLRKKMDPYMHWIDGFDYEKMFSEETFLPAERVLVKVAVALYDNGVELRFNDVFTELDQNQRQIALNAANYRYDKQDMYKPKDGNLYIN
ncbi:hypothetical protein B4102_2181 [Heyndrickxia sporothermodurans]|uniref:Uncharacterized protein n=1 Tax=Heyndrickxia sporothermodurans TaxID=46224 RepID=A0A150LGF0_9BACI|nr:hypothetical protein [Heyndrickxia sporothermodurans]KYD11453.1 hypothetical protein B4102_2181 [Heyndrickxia sporothermodurans]